MPATAKPIINTSNDWTDSNDIGGPARNTTPSIPKRHARRQQILNERLTAPAPRRTANAGARGILAVDSRPMTDLTRPIAERRRRGSTAGLVFALALAALVIVGAAAFTALVLWPRWPAQIAPDAPSVPITVGGVLFNVPPASIRVPMQRTPGTQARLDLVFLWPSLKPPGPPPRLSVAEGLPAIDRMFVTIAAQTMTLSPLERVTTVYPRYLADTQYDGPEGLKIISFRDGTPYQGEDILFDPGRPEHFLVRCTRDATSIPGICLYERRIGAADLTARFPRDWLGDWQNVSASLDKLLARLTPPTS
jgi:hypothetical protein